MGCVISHPNHAFAALKAPRGCVLNLPAVGLAEQVVGCGSTSGDRVDKFALTAKPVSMVAGDTLRLTSKPI